MSKTVNVEVSEAYFDLLTAVINLTKATKVALDDGFQAGTDLPAIVLSAVSEVPRAVAKIDQLDDDAKSDLKGVMMAVGTCVPELVDVFLKKPAAE